MVAYRIVCRVTKDKINIAILFTFSSLFTHCLCYFSATLLCIFSSNALAQNSVFKSPVSPNGVPQNAIPQSKIENTKLSDSELRTVKDRIGQKIILDFRYFCQDNTPSTRCRTPLTEMPPELLDVLSKHNIGGIILFAENIVDAKQLVSLNYSMQKHMLQKGRPPLFIAVDQEGGRVARLPPSVLPPFAGNMAIGATFQNTVLRLPRMSHNILAMRCCRWGSILILRHR